MMSKNDNIKTFDVIGERELHAYVDGLLDEYRVRRVEEYLTRHPDKAREIQDYIKYNKLLCKAYGNISDEPVPQRLLSIINRPVRNIWPTVGKVAAIILLCVLSAGVGRLTTYNENDGVATQNNMINSFLHQVALNTEPVFDTAPIEKLEIKAGAQMDPLNWLTQKVALEMHAPNLAKAGYTLERRRLVTHGAQKFVELKYANPSGNPIKLYMKTRWEKNIPSIEYVQKKGQSIAYWQEGPLVYALSGSLDRSRASEIAELVRQSMTDVPDTSPHVQDVQIITPQQIQSATQRYAPQANFGTQLVTPPHPVVPQNMNAVGGQYEQSSH